MIFNKDPLGGALELIAYAGAIVLISVTAAVCYWIWG